MMGITSNTGMGYIKANYEHKLSILHNILPWKQHIYAKKPKNHQHGIRHQHNDP